MQKSGRTLLTLGFLKPIQTHPLTEWDTIFFPILLFSSPNESCVHQEWGEQSDKLMINDQVSTDFIRDITLCYIADRFDYRQKTGPWQNSQHFMK